MSGGLANEDSGIRLRSPSQSSKVNTDDEETKSRRASRIRNQSSMSVRNSDIGRNSIPGGK